MKSAKSPRKYLFDSIVGKKLEFRFENLFFELIKGNKGSHSKMGIENLEAEGSKSILLL